MSCEELQSGEEEQSCAAEMRQPQGQLHSGTGELWGRKGSPQCHLGSLQVSSKRNPAPVAAPPSPRLTRYSVSTHWLPSVLLLNNPLCYVGYFVCMYFCVPCTCVCLLRPEEGIGPLDLTGGTDGCEPPRGSWGRSRPLDGQAAL